MATALVVASLTAAGASATAAADPTYRTERVYFQCPEGTTRVTNVDYAAGGENRRAPWSTERPQKAFGDGGGCMTLAAFQNTPALGVSVWEGTFTGNLGNFVFEGHASASPRASAYVHNSFGVHARLWIDGVQVPLAPYGFALTPQKHPSLERVFTVRFGVDLRARNLVDAAGGATTRKLRLEMEHGDSNDVVTWYIAALDTPSGLTFNAAALPLATFTPR